MIRDSSKLGRHKPMHYKGRNYGSISLVMKATGVCRSALIRQIRSSEFPDVRLLGDEISSDAIVKEISEDWEDLYYEYPNGVTTKSIIDYYSLKRATASTIFRKAIIKNDDWICETSDLYKGMVGKLTFAYHKSLPRPDHFGFRCSRSEASMLKFLTDESKSDKGVLTWEDCVAKENGIDRNVFKTTWNSLVDKNMINAQKIEFMPRKSLERNAFKASYSLIMKSHDLNPYLLKN